MSVFRGGGLTLRTAFAFAIVAALTMALSTAILAYTWQDQFDTYVQHGLQQTADGAAEILTSGYAANNGWTINTLAQMPRFGIMSGLGLQLLDADGNIIYDDLAFAEMSGQAMGVPEGVRQPTGRVVTSPVLVNGDIVGIVRVWPLSEEGLLSESDLQFRKSSISGLIVAAFIAVALASAAGVGFALTLVRPIDRITETAAALRSGKRDARTGLDSDDAIGVLGKTFDEMADAVEADREMERRLTADVAHELRTPLQAIQATVEAMQDGVLPADEEHLGIVREETRRLSRMADGILELTRLERGSVPLRTDRIDLATPVKTAIDAHRALLDFAGLRLESNVVEDVEVMGDSDRLTQAVGNLISNAARYTPEGGTVHVTLRTDGERAIVEIADTGIGIDEEDLDRVFGRFWRAASARDRESGGLGIGLAIVKEIIERHEGAVTASARQGGGSTFTISLPLAPKPESAPARKGLGAVRRP